MARLGGNSLNSTLFAAAVGSEIRLKSVQASSSPLVERLMADMCVRKKLESTSAVLNLGIDVPLCIEMWSSFSITRPGEGCHVVSVERDGQAAEEKGLTLFTFYENTANLYWRLDVAIVLEDPSRNLGSKVLSLLVVDLFPDGRTKEGKASVSLPLKIRSDVIQKAAGLEPSWIEECILPERVFYEMKDFQGMPSQS